MNDHEFLQDYVQNGSQAAFAGLVERHVGLVYSAARRLVRDTHLAEDVTQEVFMLLARKARRMGSDTILSAWLYRATRHVASETDAARGPPAPPRTTRRGNHEPVHSRRRVAADRAAAG